MKKNYPVGAVWQAVAPLDSVPYAGSVGLVWLCRRDGHLEMWMYRWADADGRVVHQDWAPSRRLAVQLCGDCFGRKVTFRRIADRDDLPVVRADNEA